MIRAEKGDIVTVHYTLTFKDGKILASTRNKEPIRFELGKKVFFDGFEKAIVGMGMGQVKKQTIQANDAFGVYDPNLLITYPRQVIPKHVRLEIGAKIEITQEDGKVAVVKVKELNDNTVVLDGNPELAGKDLQLSVELINVE